MKNNLLSSGGSKKERKNDCIVQQDHIYQQAVVHDFKGKSHAVYMGTVMFPFVNLLFQVVFSMCIIAGEGLRQVLAQDFQTLLYRTHHVLLLFPSDCIHVYCIPYYPLHNYQNIPYHVAIVDCILVESATV